MRGLGVVLIMVAACGGDDGMTIDEPDASAGSASVTMRVVNGATPSGASRPTHGPAHAVDGNWQISPDELHTILVGLEAYTVSSGTLILDLDDCGVDFDIGDPGLAQHVDCPFELPAGEYVAISPLYTSSFRVLIYDIPNGIYTDPTSPTLLTDTQPASGIVDEVTLELAGFAGPEPDTVKGTGGAMFDPPLVVNDGDTLTLTVLLDALQSLFVNVAGDTVSFGADASGNAGFPDTVISVGEPARVSYYVNDLLGSALSFGGPHPELSNSVVAISVLHGSDDQPEFLHTRGASVSECPGSQGFFFSTDGYLGLDAADTLGWAGSNAGGDFTSLWRMAAADTTQVECAATSTDPAPSGGSFASGAPTFTAARTFDLTRLAE